MISEAKTVEEYISQIPSDQKVQIEQLRKSIKNKLPKGFKEVMNYGMIGYVVPHSIYPDGYHCNPQLPLPFLALAAQKNFVAFYHMGIYADPQLLKWFTEAYAKSVSGKLDMGKSCMRFKKNSVIPYDLIGELVQKLTVLDWINLYERNYKKLPKK
ncbi:iron chaperone [Sediminibacterium sp.]|uniref:iron chaperone n=1 Tax=Sediminibacterium sp. TaxID=1917865 RepID=UPI003F72A24F